MSDLSSANETRLETRGRIQTEIEKLLDAVIIPSNFAWFYLAVVRIEIDRKLTLCAVGRILKQEFKSNLRPLKRID